MKVQLSRGKLNVLSLSLASLFAKAALFFLYVYVARQVGPDSYGLLTSSTEFVGIFLVVCSFGFQMASVRACRQSDLAQVSSDILFNKVLFLRLVVGLFVFLLAVISCFLLYWGTPNYYPIMLLSIMVLFEPLENHYYTLFWSRSELYVPAIAEVAKIFVYVFVFVAISVLSTVSVYGLMVSSLCGYITSLLFKMLWARKMWGYKVRVLVDIPFSRRFFCESFYFGVVSALYILSLRVDIQMLNQLEGKEQVGIYSAAWQLVQVGIIFIQAISTSIFPNSMANIHLESYRERLRRKILMLSFLVSLGCFLCTFIAPFVIELIYGSGYQAAGVVFAIIIWYLPIRLFAIFPSQILESGVWYKRRIAIYFLPLVVNILLNLYLIPSYGAIGAASSALISNALLGFLLLYYSRMYEKKFF